MFQITFVAFFIILLILSIYIFRSIKDILWFNVLMILCALIQGIIISYFVANLLYAVTYAIMYYLLFTRILFIVKFLIKSKNFPELNEQKLINAFEGALKLKGMRFIFRRFTGKNSFNAIVKKIYHKPKTYEIYIGDMLRKNFTLEECTAIIAHELSHAIKHHHLKMVISIFVLAIVIPFISFIINILIVRINMPLFYFLNITIFLFIFIIGLNTISWHYEYEADKHAVRLTGNKNALMNAFHKFSQLFPMRDFGKFLNLILYDHPLHKDRIKKLII
ncbi:MAG TPA: hypothetical protein ENI52_01405 [Thermoplasmata archaeon]|nr:hypothetical protein [Thermoplasmata archaeon]